MSNYLEPIPARKLYRKVDLGQQWIDFKRQNKLDPTIPERKKFKTGKWKRLCKQLNKKSIGVKPKSKVSAPKFEGRRWYEKGDKRVVQF